MEITIEKTANEKFIVTVPQKTNKSSSKRNELTYSPPIKYSADDIDTLITLVRKVVDTLHTEKDDYKMLFNEATKSKKK